MATKQPTKTPEQLFAQVQELFTAELRRFLETGIFSPEDVWGPRNDWQEIERLSVPIVSKEKIARAMAGRLKRPFVQWSTLVAYGEWTYDPATLSSKHVPHPEPIFHHAWVSIPRQARCAIMFGPLYLASTDDGPVQDRSNKSQCRFQITDKAFADAYLENLLTCPAMRAARGLKPVDGATG